MAPNTSCLKHLIFSWKKNIQLDVDKEGNLVKENLLLQKRIDLCIVLLYFCTCGPSHLSKKVAYSEIIAKKSCKFYGVSYVVSK